ncbi:hypothetical protein AC1031_021527 [Aphanomyces cochlioides]|nr:hypothetical protein AC1031_021527 [Aphanomyces cochlioides]
MAHLALLNLLKNLTDLSGIRMNSGLEILNVSHDLLADVSTTFPPSLRVLDLSYNQLRSFNLSVAPSLTQLSLRANHIENLVLTLDSFPANLRLLDLAGNPSLQLYVDKIVFEKLTAPGFTLLLTSRWNDIFCRNLTLLQPPSQVKLGCISALLQDERRETQSIHSSGLSKRAKLAQSLDSSHDYVAIRSVFHRSLVQLPSIDAHASFHQLNLSHNKLAAVPTRWPSVLSTLDLCLNRLTSLDFSTMPPSLSNLSLRGNNLTEMELTKTTFPPSLDITDNPQLVLRLDEVALAKLVAANFSLVVASDNKKTTKGCTTLARIGTQLVCLNPKPTTTTSTHRSYSPGFLIAVLICTGIFLYGSMTLFLYGPRLDCIRRGRRPIPPRGDLQLCST